MATQWQFTNQPAMMRQSENPFGVGTSVLTAAAAAIAEEITGEERLEELKKQGSKSAVYNLTTKKKKRCIGSGRI